MHFPVAAVDIGIRNHVAVQNIFDFEGKIHKTS